MELAASSAAGVSAGSAQSGLLMSPIELGEALIKAERRSSEVKLNFFSRVAIGISSLINSVLNNDADTSKNETLQKNKVKGKAAEKEVTKELEEEFPDDIVLTQVTGKFADGSKTIFDNVIIDGETAEVKETNETKSGNAKKSRQQKRYRSDENRPGEEVELVGEKAGPARGQKINDRKIPDRETRKP